MRSILLFGFLGWFPVIMIRQNRYNTGSINHTNIGRYDTIFIRELINGVGDVGPVSLRYNVSAVRMNYLSGTPDGVSVTVSGLLVLPQSEGTYPLMSIQHGMVIKRSNVSFRDPLKNEGVVGMIAESGGYITCIPD